MNTTDLWEYFLGHPPAELECFRFARLEDHVVQTRLVDRDEVRGVPFVTTSDLHERGTTPIVNLQSFGYAMRICHIQNFAHITKNKPRLPILHHHAHIMPAEIEQLRGTVIHNLLRLCQTDRSCRTAQSSLIIRGVLLQPHQESRQRTDQPGQYPYGQVPTDQPVDLQHLERTGLLLALLDRC